MGLVLNSAKGGTISGIHFQGSDNMKDIGIQVHSGDWVIENCHFDGDFNRAIGIGGENTNITVKNCRFDGVSFGILSFTKAKARIENNEFVNITSDAIQGLSGSTLQINKNTFQDINKNGISVFDSSNVEVYENTLKDIKEKGISVNSGSIVQAHGNKFQKIRTGIDVCDGSSGMVKDNEILDCSYGINLRGEKTNLTIQENSINQINNHGIYIYGSEGIIESNKIYNCTICVECDGSGTNFQIIKNTIATGLSTSLPKGKRLEHIGLKVSRSAGVMFSENTINTVSNFNGSGIGILLESEAHGKLINNTITKCLIGVSLSKDAGAAIFEANNVSGNKQDWKKPLMGSKVTIK